MGAACRLQLCLDEKKSSSKKKRQRIIARYFRHTKKYIYNDPVLERGLNPFQCAAAVAVFFLHPKSTPAMFILPGKKAFSTADESSTQERMRLSTLLGRKGVNPAFRRPSKAIINLNERCFCRRRCGLFWWKKLAIGETKRALCGWMVFIFGSQVGVILSEKIGLVGGFEKRSTHSFLRIQKNVYINSTSCYCALEKRVNAPRAVFLKLPIDFIQNFFNWLRNIFCISLGLSTAFLFVFRDIFKESCC